MKRILNLLVLLCVIFHLFPIFSNAVAQSVALILNTASDNITKIDLEQFKVINTIDVGDGPRGIAINSEGTYAYIANMWSNDITTIDLTGDTIVESIYAGEFPKFLVVSPDDKLLYVTIGFAQKIMVYDFESRVFVDSIALDGWPSEIKFSEDGQILYALSVVPDKIYIIDANTNTIVLTHDLGEFRLPEQIAFSPESSLVYVANWDSEDITVLRMSDHAIIKTIPIGIFLKPHDLAISHDGRKAYVPSSTNHTVNVIDLSADTISSMIDAGWEYGKIEISESGSTAYVTSFPGSFKRIDLISETVIDSLKIDGFANIIALTNDPPLFPEPHILSIKDVKNDQGKYVSITFRKSIFDDNSFDSAVTHYSILRRREVVITKGNATKANQRVLLSHLTDQQSMTFSMSDSDSVQWDTISTYSAKNKYFNNIIVPTMVDSSIFSGINWSAFQIIAQTNDTSVFYVSAIDSGYSVDNLIPGTPEDFTAVNLENSILLWWRRVTDIDFWFYEIHKSKISGFIPSVTTRYALLADTSFGDGDIEIDTTYYYKIAAVDHSWNQSEFSHQVSGIVVDIEEENLQIPIEYSLQQNHPNPFNPVTNISYSLPVSGDLTLIIYNLLGEEVARLVDGFQQAGEYKLTWNASNVSSGIYFYRLRSGDFTLTKKMVLLK